MALHTLIGMRQACASDPEMAEALELLIRRHGQMVQATLDQRRRYLSSGAAQRARGVRDFDAGQDVLAFGMEVRCLLLTARLHAHRTRTSPMRVLAAFQCKQHHMFAQWSYPPGRDRGRMVDSPRAGEYLRHDRFEAAPIKFDFGGFQGGKG